jgi:glycosyltransferase involved in cell wall biosynthesis
VPVVPHLHDEVVFDLRPLQGGDSSRGIGATVRGLAGCFPEYSALVWSGRPVPAEASGRALCRVKGPRLESRMSWAMDSLTGRMAHLRSPGSLWHLMNADASFDGGGRYVVTVNDTIPWRFPEMYPAGPTGRLRMAAAAHMCRRARLVVVPSEVSADDVTRLLGVSRHRVRVIPWAPDPGLRPDTSRVDPTNGESPPTTYLVMAGGFAHHDPRKRYEDALVALGGLPDDVVLFVTGSDGAGRRPFEKTVERLGLAGRVRLTGQLPIEELSALFAGARAFVFPSMWEGFGLPLIDAFTLGVPAVISDGGSLPEVSGGAALVYQAGDTRELTSQIKKVLGDRGLATELSERGRQRSADFSWEKTAQMYREVYREAGAVQ